ncbi:FAD-dependent oxidoreductase [Curvibacter sp. HBC61]|uniref:FAD-dependent oxidoreductase n=1 Tax=Curvibacter cyanobacteriorum TaxID=3026422 RepID=A0ABT5MUM7_9BURK|nr:FAD-dependent oxidoreductase [Curvibacter sp. HBC61]MDD0837747.1 FAD-dependent oxidoreductase [Curvibacter sp. HBC61]
MTAVKKVLVVGGGFSGMAAAIRMRRHGIEVDLVEIDPQWCPMGAGITLGGASLRALQTLGVYEAVAEQGHVVSGVEICLPTGQKVADLPTPIPVGSTVEGGGGIMRPTLARILADATRQAGVSVRLGCSWSAISQDSEGVAVLFDDGSHGRYDLVVGADGVHSKLRSQFFPEVKPPEYIGQGVWRAVLPRPDAIVRPRMWLGQHIKVGVNPVSSTHMYMFITEDRPTKEHIDPATWPQVFAGLMRGFPDPLITALIPHALTPEAAIDYRPLANLLVPAPWNRGRLVLIGDTVAATTPHLASGAGIGIESGIVLADELAAASALQPALDAFHARRWDRCRLVIQNSERLCRIEIEGGDKQEHAQIMRDSLAALAQPI